MAKFMDVHNGLVGVTEHQLREARGCDLAVEAAEGVHVEHAWLDLARYQTPRWLRPARSQLPGLRARSAPAGTQIVLRDGSHVLIRQVQSADAPLLADGFARLSADSRWMRFLTPKKVNGSVWRGVPAKLGWRGGCGWSRAGVAGVRCAARAPAGAVTGSRVADAGVLRNRFP